MRADAHGGSAATGSALEGIPGRVFMKWFGTFFVLLSIGVLVGGYYITGGVRRQAAETDTAVRFVAFELLRWSAAHDGRFPTSEAEFLAPPRLAADPPAPPPPPRTSDPALWPTDARTALQGKKPTSIEEALARVKVEWPPKSNLAPEISSNGKATLPRTVTIVRDWLHAWLKVHGT